jgi:phospholipid/cholesterol/gamma-HCH transport system substrate-binding protein
MEIRARYFLIGLFVLAVIGAGVGFVYWLYNTGGLTERTDYLVSFKGSVSGLSPGSPVLFNGLQVGEVTGLSLSADDPELVIAHISIDARTPVRTDTYVGMDFRGLTGTATIALAGGSLAAPPPASIEGRPPLLVADSGATKDMTTSAREALSQLNTILSDNATPLKDAISNIDIFAAVLADNSDKIDAILAGLESFVGGGAKSETVSYELTAPTTFPEIAALPSGQLSVAAPTTVVALDSQRITIKGADGLVPAFENVRWADSVPLLVQSRLVQGFENAGYPGVGSDVSGINGDFQLLVNIRRFEIDTTASPMANVAMMAKILDIGGTVFDAHLFEASAPVADAGNAEQAAAGIDAAFGDAATDMIVWSLGVMSAADAGGLGDMSLPADGAMSSPADLEPMAPPEPAAAESSGGQ